MNLRRHACTFFALLGAFLLLPSLARAQLPVVGDGGPGPVKAQHLTAELVTLAPGPAPAIAPGGTLQVGLVLTLEEHWHVYWINAGDSGQPPHITWTLPRGITAGPMLFPIPSRLPLGPLMDFGYEDNVAFPVLLTASPKLKPGPIHLDAKVDWLVCREVCIPGKAHLGLNLTVGPASSEAPPVGALGEALTLIPRPLPEKMKFSVLGGRKDFVLTLITGDVETDAEFYPLKSTPDEPDQIVNAIDQPAEQVPGGIRIRVPRAPDPDHPNVTGPLPKTLHGLMKLSADQAYEVTAPVIPGELPAPTAPVLSNPATSDLTTLGAIGLAFLGGIILNLMPCVFPVLFLKGLALVNSSGQERAHQRSHGLVYTLGILVSFWIIVAVLLVVRAGGSQAGWGFQLQSPIFIAVLASFLFFFALSLAGQFDLGLSLTSAGGSLAQKQGYTGSFFTGVLATVVATPCTAPLMGAAIGFALAQPAWITFAVFTALGLGLALPYLLLSIQPAWTRILPRPGAWMEILKQLTAIPLFGTVIWLAWVYGRLFPSDASVSLGEGNGIDQLARLLWCFLVLALAGWVLGRWPARRTGAIVATLLVVAALAIPLSTARSASQPESTSLLTWQPFSQQTLDTARAAGHPVFIDFTAAWCLSCQVNERIVLRSPEVQHQFAIHNVTLLKADWTRYDAAITQELTTLNRSGVPTYVLYPAATNSNPDVLPEVLTKAIVLGALSRDLAQPNARP